MEDVVRQAAALYDSGDLQALLSFAEEVWPVGEGVPAPGVSEVCRYTFILSQRHHDATAGVWLARAHSAAVLTGARDTVAGLMLREAFILAERKQFASVHAVLEEILRLVPADAPRSQLFRGRLYNEKKAYFLALEGRFSEAVGFYELASRHCGDDERGRLKVAGGKCVAAYLALGQAANDALKSSQAELREELEDILIEARSHGFPDVEASAEANLKLMTETRFDDWTPFETT